jgi:hypothetical protein
MADILAYEKSGSIELAGYTLGEGDVKVSGLLASGVRCGWMYCGRLCGVGWGEVECGCWVHRDTL